MMEEKVQAKRKQGRPQINLLDNLKQQAERQKLVDLRRCAEDKKKWETIMVVSNQSRY